MPRNTQGGNKAKKGANKNNIPKKIEEPDEEQYIGLVTKYLGNNRCKLTYISINEKKERKQMDVMGLVRGAIKKRIKRLACGDLVLLSPRDYELTKVDILTKYTDSDVNRLKKLGHIDSDILKFRNDLNTKMSQCKVVNTNFDNEYDEIAHFEAENESESEDEAGEKIDKAEKKRQERYNAAKSYGDIYGGLNMDDDNYDDDYGNDSNKKIDAFGNFINDI